MVEGVDVRRVEGYIQVAVKSESSLESSRSSRERKSAGIHKFIKQRHTIASQSSRETVGFGVARKQVQVDRWVPAENLCH